MAGMARNLKAILLQNNTSSSSSSSSVWAYITGLDINRNNAVFVLQSDGATGYYPDSPAKTLSPLARDCHIQIGGPGTSRAVTIPQLAGGRIWFCRGAQLRFQLNPGPALVEPSVTNASDPNYALSWAFAEFTFNAAQVFANISYVDFVSLPISLALASEDADTPRQMVPGLPASGLDAVCAELAAQHDRDGAGWNKLIVRTPPSDGSEFLRALSPNSAMVMDSTLFSSYYQPYVDAVWAKYALTKQPPLTIDTQNAEWGTAQGQTTTTSPPSPSPPPKSLLTFTLHGGSSTPSPSPSPISFPQPSTADIFSCSTGAFAQQPAAPIRNNIAARLAAAFNRSTLLINPDQPAAEKVVTYYASHPITNHYARVVHAASLPDGKGYAFPYDDVAPDNDASNNVAGTVADARPRVLVVAEPIKGGR
ncbi:glucanase B [Podospora didyma]|uniref:Glucanase B n=1 Tax=Podospora didyma TaxID=330526 RepID=A0AAE0KGH8_9PEZI|nr:glucanase B [Podospora didyma]